VDLIFSDVGAQLSLQQHEYLSSRLSRLLSKAPEISAAAESSSGPATSIAVTSDDGFCITFYLYGYGDDESDAAPSLGHCAHLVQNALTQVTAAQRKGGITS